MNGTIEGDKLGYDKVAHTEDAVGENVVYQFVLALLLIMTVAVLTVDISKTISSRVPGKKRVVGTNDDRDGDIVDKPQLKRQSVLTLTSQAHRCGK